MTWPSLDDLFGGMIARGAKQASRAMEGIDPSSVLVPMSVRVHPRTKAYLEAMGTAIGAPSASALVSMILEGVLVATMHPDESVRSLQKRIEDERLARQISNLEEQLASLRKQVDGEREE